MSDTQSLYRYLAFTDNSPYRRYIRVEELDPNKKGNSGKPLTDGGAAHGSYGSLLFDPRWKLKRQEVLTRDNHRCAHCKDTQNLQVHHRQYHFVVATQQFKLPWDYPNSLLITLCERCHNKGHRKFKVPTVNI